MSWLCVYVLFCYLAWIPFVRWVVKPVWGPPSKGDVGLFCITAPVSFPVLVALFTIVEGYERFTNFLSYLIGE